MSDQRAALTYSSYLALDEVLGAQRPRTDEHDELLFIVIHQVNELWFKELLHEGAHLQARLEDGDSPHALHTLKRMLTILKTVVAQIDVLETMTPRQFLTFRDRLEAASGFQSAQFRELEAFLGRRDPRALDAYAPDSPDHARIAAAMARPSLFDSFVRYLANQGYSAAAAALDRDVTQPLEPSDAVQQALLAAYADDGEPAQVCERMIDLDEGVMEWRYRHVQMVRRTIGDKRGTGGSGGASYLRDDAAAAGVPGSVGGADGALSVVAGSRSCRESPAVRLSGRGTAGSRWTRHCAARRGVLWWGLKGPDRRNRGSWGTSARGGTCQTPRKRKAETPAFVAEVGASPGQFKGSTCGRLLVRKTPAAERKQRCRDRAARSA